jgi:hypothetical protein
MYLWFEMNASKFDVNFDSFQLILEVTLIQDNLYRLYMHSRTKSSENIF